MHEMGITKNIVSIVAEHAKTQKVKRVQLEIGKLSAVMPDALQFCFDVVAKGTVLEGATLEIIEVVGRAKCRACGAEVELHQIVTACTCGSRDLERLSGEELNIKEMELEAA
ncbi:MAG: hydrogenase maturation nickel metallochaperone HypA [Robiginitomaculum sp.]|nr:hydrogenase maturation nickel metallochaperone HypA [Robiginitomaculum sp.]PHS35645.1 MAG: hydrogenase maturation nickel metallochaperone HypA [Robiginitomaculum sp.]